VIGEDLQRGDRLLDDAALRFVETAKGRVDRVGALAPPGCAARRSPSSEVRVTRPASTSWVTDRDSIVGLSPSDSPSTLRRIGPRRSIASNSELRVGDRPAATPAGVERRRRDNRPITIRSRAADSVSSTGVGEMGVEREVIG
jgi:hypothetical protein